MVLNSSSETSTVCPPTETMVGGAAVATVAMMAVVAKITVVAVTTTLITITRNHRCAIFPPSTRPSRFFHSHNRFAPPAVSRKSKV